MGDVNADCFLCNSGCLRSDRIHKAGDFKMGDLMNILPIDDPIIVVKCTGDDIVRALENGVSLYPRKEGRFLQVSGIKFTFDESRSPGNRIVTDKVIMGDNEIDLDEEYVVAVKEYMYHGHDGFDMFKNCEVIMNEESGVRSRTAVVNFFKGIQQRIMGTDTKKRLPIVPRSRECSIVLGLHDQQTRMNFRTLASTVRTMLSVQNDAVRGRTSRRCSVVKGLPDQLTRRRLRKSVVYEQKMNLLERDYAHVAPTVEGRVCRLLTGLQEQETEEDF